MFDTDNLFFELIQVSIGRCDSLSRIPSANEWSILYRLAVKQAVAGVCFYGVQQLAKEQREELPKELMLQWLAVAEGIKLRNVLMNRSCVEMQRLLSADGFRNCILKGQGVALLYNDYLRSLRQSGDIDVWVDSDMEHVLDYVMKRVPSETFDMKHIHYDLFEDIDVELHWIPSVSGVPSRNARLKRFYEAHKDVFDNRVSLPSGEVISAANARMNVVYLLMHIQGHYLYEGIGMRQLMDYYFTLLHLGESYRALAKKEIKKLGLQKILSAVMYVMVVVFGLDEDYRLCKYDKNLGEELLDDIMNCGNFGQYSSENNVKNESWIHWGWRRLKRRFKLIRYDSASLLFRPIYRLRVALTKIRISKKYNF